MHCALLTVTIEPNSAESGSDGSSDASEDNDQNVCISTLDINVKPVFFL